MSDCSKDSVVKSLLSGNDFFDMYVTIKAMKDCVETYLLLHGG